MTILLPASFRRRLDSCQHPGAGVDGASVGAGLPPATHTAAALAAAAAQWAEADRRHADRHGRLIAGLRRVAEAIADTDAETARCLV